MPDYKLKNDIIPKVPKFLFDAKSLSVRVCVCVCVCVCAQDTESE